MVVCDKGSILAFKSEANSRTAFVRRSDGKSFAADCKIDIIEDIYEFS
jgi:hypothetical protein